MQRKTVIACIGLAASLCSTVYVWRATYHAPPTQQVSRGSESPNVADVDGKVTITTGPESNGNTERGNGGTKLEQLRQMRLSGEISKSEFQRLVHELKTPLPVPSDEELLEQSLAKLKKGNLAYSTPEKMKSGHTAHVTARIGSEKVSMQTLESGMPTDQGAKTGTAVTPVSTKMKVTLKGADFEITPLSTEEQAVAGLKVVDLLAGIVNKFLDAWDKIAKMRKLREEAVSFGVGGPGIEEFDRVITEEVEEVIEESTQLALVGFDGRQDRRHELENGLKQDFHRLFGQIEVGLTVQFRAEKNPAAEEEEELAIENITNISENIKFPTPAHNPLLLPSASLLQGELHGVKVVKTTRTSRRVKTDTTIDPKSKKT